MNYQQKTMITCLISVFLILSIGITLINNKPVTKTPSAGYGIQGDLITRMNTSTEVLASSTASTLILATSTARTYAIIGNNSATASLFLSLTGGGAAVVNKGVKLLPGEKYEINALNLYIGAIYAIASSTSASTTVMAAQ